MRNARCCCCRRQQLLAIAQPPPHFVSELLRFTVATSITHSYDVSYTIWLLQEKPHIQNPNFDLRSEVSFLDL